MCFEIPVKHISRRRCSFSRGRTNSSFLFCFESCYAIKMFMILPLTNLTSTMSLAVTLIVGIMKIVLFLQTAAVLVRQGRLIKGT